ncbi:sn-glycerol-3-phosphate ABC transporter ATP-binding protein UgpC [Mesorhizobium sp. B2-3-5]|uniref:ABC transporter ATP-binding protein n=1 Tax=Mesorhizobium sp. B2-3-5 TaxID=2589958 RepID=UPI001128EBC1|nr:sn-glycerol-3-phosphate ABC transporter ATP-binding protein UgpC [Mesorhizobium sp. B2-3-5]TPM24247.1 sn-glycerol-3-phosphate ABC transporter ATP-binding protein UgpC [Mesorhizobium sp. B2-3-5]
MQGVELVGINKSYGAVQVVKDVDLSLGHDEFVVLVGPSGCGKTTTLRMVAGLETITSGKLSIRGQHANHLSPAQRDVAMVFQNYALYPNMNVYDNMAFGLRNRGMPKAQVDSEIRRAADVLALGKLLDRKPRQLSGGQQQRVALGRCLVRNPKLFLFDEPLSNLDAKLRLEMRQELKRLKSRITATSIYVTHDQIEAMTLGDRVVVMANGEVQQAGTPEDIYHRPRNIFVATFIGSPPMNIIEVGITSIGDRSFFTAGDLKMPVPDRLKAAVLSLRGNALLGLRPEHIVIDGACSSSFASGNVDITELLGSEQLVQVRLGEKQVTVTRVDPFRRLSPGQAVNLSIATEEIHVFDPATQQNIADHQDRRAATPVIAA